MKSFSPTALLALLLAIFVSCYPCFIAAQGECSGTISQLRFQPAYRAERSYITSEDETVNVGVGIPIPRIAIEAILIGPSGAVAGRDDAANGHSVLVYTEPQLRLAGALVEIVDGFAVFDGLLIQEYPDPSIPTPYHFRFIDKANEASTLRSGPLVFHSASQQNTVHHITFGTTGYFYLERQTRSIAVDVGLPSFSIEAHNVFGHLVDRDIVACVVEATTSYGNFTSQTTFSGDSIVSITGLSFSFPDQVVNTTKLPVFTFSLQSPSTGPLPSNTSTGVLIPVITPQRNRFMRFHATRSFFQQENIGGTAVFGQRLPPIVVELLTWKMELDTSDTGLVITATSEDAEMSGHRALTVRGEASFTDLTFVGRFARSAVITFTAGTQGSWPVSGYRIISGSVRIAKTAVRARHLSFSPWSAIQNTGEITVPISLAGVFQVPLVSVAMLDTAYYFDTKAENRILMLKTDPEEAAVPTSMSIRPMKSGFSAFYRPTFVNATPGRIRLVVSEVPSGGLPPRQSLISSDIVLVSSDAPMVTRLAQCRSQTTDCPFFLRFASSGLSLIHAEEQSLFCTVGTTIPEIRIELVDRINGNTVANLSSTDVAQMSVVAFTGNDYTTEELLQTDNQANYGKWTGSGFKFDCLQLKSVPSRLARIQFRALFSVLGAFYVFTGIMPIRTGFVSVHASRTPSVAIRFVRSAHFMQHEGQSTTAVVNVALPEIVLEVCDSAHLSDSTAGSTSEVVVKAVTSAGKLAVAGSQTTIVQGRAVFSLLRFTQAANDAQITFTATQPLLPLDKSSVTTGAIMVTRLPVPFLLVALNAPTPQYREIHVSSTAATRISASVNLLDSAHALSDGNNASVVLQAHSSGAALTEDVQFTISTDTPCHCGDVNVTVSPIGTLEAHVTLKVIAGTVQGLIGKEIFLALLKSNESSSCLSSVEEPVVIAEYNVPIELFSSRIPLFSSSVASTLGIEAERLHFSNIRLTAGVMHNTLEEWVGSKVDITVREPLPSSINRRSATDLASELAVLSEACVADSLGLMKTYFKDNDRSCDVGFIQEKAEEARKCTVENDRCMCYAEIIFNEWGTRCSGSPLTADTMKEACYQSTGCLQASIVDTCDTLKPVDKFNFYWLFFGTVFLAIPVGIYAKRKFSSDQEVVALHVQS